MKERIKQRLRELTDLVGVSGAEQEVVAYLRDQLLPVADEVTVDAWGNVIAVKHGTKPGAKLMVAAHSDEIGLSVKNILSSGYIVFDKVGDVPDNLLQGRKVWITSRKIPGIVGSVAGHLQTTADSKGIRGAQECYIDVGVGSRSEAEALGIRIGDPIVFQSDFMEMSNPDLVSTRAVDNRVSCAIVVELFQELQGKEFPGSVYGVITVQEEVGLRGAAIAGNTVQPDYAIVLDTISAGDTPDIDTERQLPVVLGNGPACPVRDGVTSESVYTFIHPKVRAIIEGAAEKTQTPLQYLTFTGGYYVTDAASFALTGKGMPVGVIATPRRYSHSPVELVNVNDAAGVLTLVKAIVLDNHEREFGFL